MNAIFLNTCRNGYTPEQCGETFTLNDLIEHLEFLRDSDNAGGWPVYFRNDNGYTYGGITWDTFNEDN